MSKIKTMKRLFAYTPNLSQSFWLLLLLIICQIPTGFLGALLPQALGDEYKSWGNLAAYVFTFILMGCIIIRLGKDQSSAIQQQNILDLDNSQTSIDSLSTPVHGIKAKFPLYILLLFLMPSLSVAIEPLYMWWPIPQWIEELFASMFRNDFGTFVVVAIAAPLCEEWLCRGIILRGLLKHDMVPYKAIFWSALIFAIMHLNPWQAIPAFCLGFAIGWVYWRTRSLWPCIFMHAVNNSLAFLMMFIFPDASANSTLYNITGNHYLLIYSGAVIMSCIIGYMLWKKLKGNTPTYYQG